MWAKRKQQRAFTITELLVVIVVIGIIALISSLAFLRYMAEARDRARESDIISIMAAAEKYYDQHGEYPYNEELNPTAAMGKLPNYETVKSLLPDLSDDTLGDDSGYNFWAIGCRTCTSTPSQLAERAKQYIYFSAFGGTELSYLQYPYSPTYPYLWGCRVEASDTDPGFMIAWRSEVTGLWTFKKGNHGEVSIMDVGSSRPPGQTCTWS